MPDIWLLMTPLRKARVEFAVEKAVELGVSRIKFVTTEFSVQRSLNLKRLRAIAIEAAEQCGGMSIPLIEEVQSLDSQFEQWSCDRRALLLR